MTQIIGEGLDRPATVAYNGPMGGFRPSRAITATVVLLGVLVLAASAQAAGPRLYQLSYEHSRDGSSKRFNVSAYAHHADSVRFITRRNHDPLAATGRYNDSITDTNLPAPPDARHPWEIDRQNGGKQVLKAIRSSLKRRGEATVRVIARRGDARDKAKVTIEVADCSQDPPLYPLSCEIGL